VFPFCESFFGFFLLHGEVPVKPLSPSIERVLLRSGPSWTLSVLPPILFGRFTLPIDFGGVKVGFYFFS